MPNHDAYQLGQRIGRLLHTDQPFAHGVLAGYIERLDEATPRLPTPGPTRQDYGIMPAAITPPPAMPAKVTFHLDGAKSVVVPDETPSGPETSGTPVSPEVARVPSTPEPAQKKKRDMSRLPMLKCTVCGKEARGRGGLNLHSIRLHGKYLKDIEGAPTPAPAPKQANVKLTEENSVECINACGFRHASQGAVDRHELRCPKKPSDMPGEDVLEKSSHAGHFNRTERRILLCLRSGDKTQLEIVEATGIARRQVYGAIDGLVAAEYVRRTPSLKDTRQMVHILDKKAMDLLRHHGILAPPTEQVIA